MKLIGSVVKTFKVAKSYRMGGRISSFEFSPNGDAMVSGGEDDQIVIYDCIEGVQSKIIGSIKYGVGIVLFGHTKNTLLHSSTKNDDNIRYLCIENNKYIRYFSGHTKKVVTLCLCPKQDLFISGSVDNTLRLWDSRSPNCQGLMHLSERPVAAFDPEGLIFATGLNSECIKLYDLRNYDRGPFVTFKIPVQIKDEGSEWTGLKFSPDEKTLLVSSNGSRILLVDAFNGTVLQNFTGFLNKKSLPIEASFSPDSQFVFSGSTDGQIHVWNSDNGYKLCVLNHSETTNLPTQCVKFNPHFMMLASASTSMLIWVPSVE